MKTPEDRMAELGLVLPEVPTPAGNYLPYRRAGSILSTAGIISLDALGEPMTGRVGDEVDTAYAAEAARCCALSLLAVLKEAAGDLFRVEHLLTLTGFVNAIPAYPDAPIVLNGASDLLGEVLGDAGAHARAAVGVAALPKHCTVEIQASALLRT